jgi:ABC-2 type transport system permease protein
MTGAAIASQVRVEQRIFWRNRSGMFFTFVFPLLVLGFMAMFSDRARLVPGVAALAIVSTSFQALAISLTMHREQGVLKRLMATPLTPQSLVAAKIVSASIVALLEVGVIVAVGAAVFGIGAPHDWPVLVATVVAGVAACSALAFAVAAIIPTGEAAPAVTNAIYLPMMFISGVFYPLSRMPQVLVWAAQALPLWHLVAPLRAAWTGSVRPGEVALHVGVLAAWTLLGVVVAARRFVFTPSHER